MEKLYCVHCDKTYTVEADAVRLMQANGKKIAKKDGVFRFEQGCFFKELAALKRKARRI